MIVRYNTKDSDFVFAFLGRWVDQTSSMVALLSADEAEPIYLDCDLLELQNAIMELESKGFTQSAKQIFQGDHFYRSDCGKCLRCRRHRPEVAYDVARGFVELCDRCREVLK